MVLSSLKCLPFLSCPPPIHHFIVHGTVEGAPGHLQFRGRGEALGPLDPFWDLYDVVVEKLSARLFY